MNELQCLANRCKVECVDGSVAEDVRIFLDGENLVYSDSSGNSVDGCKTLEAQVFGDVRTLCLIRQKEMAK